MDILDIFLNKYSYKFPKGYPDMNNEQDVLLMESLLNELGVNEEENKDLTFEQCKEILFKSVKLKKEYINKIKDIYNAQSEKDQKAFLENFQKHSINDLDSISDIYKDYINISDENGGLGKGEITVLLGVKNSVSGGKNEKDIKIGENEKYEIKELSKGKEFRPAADGSITNSTFQKHYVYLMSLLSVINKDNNKDNNKAEQIDEKKTEENIQDLVSRLIIYYNSKYKTGNISEGILDNIRKGLLPKIKSYTKTEKDDKEKIYIKIEDKKYEIDKVVLNTDGKPESVKLGLEIKEQEALIAKLLKHPWVKNPKELDKDLNEIWLDYLKTVNGLIIYGNNKFNFYDSSNAEKEFYPCRVAQNQIFLKLESARKSPPSDEETEVQ